MIRLIHFCLTSRTGLLATLGLTLQCGESAYADLGWTLAQSVQAYGEPTSTPMEDGYEEELYQFESQGYTIQAGYLQSRVGSIRYYRQAGALDEPLINFFKT